jgi:hypothetical protein
MICKCPELTELEGNEAKNYAGQHLTEVFVNGKTWEIEYKCPDTGARWLMDFPQSEYHGGGPPRLRKLTGSSGTK